VEGVLEVKAQYGLFLLAGLGLIFLAQACSRPLPPEEPCSFVQTPEQQRVSWNKKLPVKFYIHESVPKEAYGAIDRAVDEYNQHLGGGREIIRIVARGSSGDLSPQKDGNSIIYWFDKDKWDDSRKTEQARTTIYWSGAQIFEADIRINADDFEYFLAEEAPSVHVDLTSLLVHELGHALGLAHNVTHGSVMNLSLAEGQERRKLSDTDLANLRCEY
jgi:hypothetical protein